MTEKRFTLIKDTGTDECYCDNLYDNGTYIGAIAGGSEMICYLLNEQHKTIISLQVELSTHKHPLWSTREAERIVNELENENEQLKQQREQFFVRERDTKNRWRELKEENEQLKQQIQQLKHWNKCLAEKRHNELKGDVE